MTTQPSANKLLVCVAVLAMLLPFQPLLHAAPDVDGNGLSDIWQAFYQLGPISPFDDLDGDGLTNAEEEAAGTDPLDPGSGLAIAGIDVQYQQPVEEADPQGIVQIRWASQLGKMYQLENATDVAGPWTEVGPPELGTGHPILVVLDSGEIKPLQGWGIGWQGYFRLRVWDEDRDGDGLNGWEEGTIDTDPDNPNTGGGRGGDPAVADQWLSDHLPASFLLHEVVLAHLGGSPLGPHGASSPAQPYDYATRLVTAVGSAQWVKLSSWTINPNNHQAVPLEDSAALDGFNAQLLALKPEKSPNLTINPFVMGRLVSGGNLWLKLYTLKGTGGFNDLATIGYGNNASVRVRNYAMDYRYRSGSGPQTSYLVVTPLIATDSQGDNHLRVVTWRATPGAGTLTGLQDSGPLSLTDVSTNSAHLSIRYLGDHTHVVTYANEDGVLVSRFVGVTDQGHVSDQGGDASGLDIRGDNNVTVNLSQGAAGAMTAGGYVTAVLDASNAMQLQVWEQRLVACDAGCYSRPFLISDSTVDTQPNVNGVQLPNPVLTDSGDEDDRFGRVLATGDFNNDGFGDLAVGLPDSNDHAGEVNIFHGSATGYSTTGQDQTWIQGKFGLSGLEESWDQFGYALAVGNFDGDAYQDLAIGVPGESVDNNTIESAGAVQVLYGSANGLTTTGSQIWTQASPDIVGVPLEGELFGQALAAGDFNGDGFSDLGIGIPRQEVSGQEEAGAVQIIYGTQGGLHALGGPGNEIRHQDSDGMRDQAEAFDWFGFVLAAGNLNGDGEDDLIIGIPYEDELGLTNNGAVQVIYGTTSGLGTTDDFFSQAGFEPGGGDVIGAPESFDLFGWSLTRGNFNGDNYDDLAVGASMESVDNNTIDGAGAVHIFYGTPNGLSAMNNQIVTQDGFQGGADIYGAPEENDRFGYALTSGDYDDDGYDELVVGVYVESVDGNTVEGAGVAHLIYGSVNGLSGSNDQIWYQGYGDLAGNLEPFDWLGNAVAMIDINGDGRDDAILGSYGEDVGSDIDAGGALVVFGSTTINGNDGSQFLVQDSEERVRAQLTDLQWQKNYGAGPGTLFSKTAPAGEPDEVHIASVTKTMTLLLAVEAIENAGSNIALDDKVTISALAAGTGGSKMSPLLEEDDVLPFELLLHGMMMPSGNRASVAISEHIGATVPGYQTLGAATNFILLMNEKAQALGMTDTVYGHPAGGCVTTPADQIKLWTFARQYPLFLDIAGARLYDGCGVASNGTEKCFFLVKHSDSGYPGLGSWKNGNGGLWFWNDNDLWDDPAGVPWCTSSVLGESTRLDRTLIAGISQTGDRWGDHDRLLDYGYRKLFTPDYRGGTTQVGLTIADFDLDKVHDTLSVTAVIDGNRLRVDTWQVVAGIGQIGFLAAGTKTIDDLPEGKQLIPPTELRMTMLPTVSESMADPLTARKDAVGNLVLDVWRVAAEPGN